MTNNEKRILGQLYNRPNDQNATNVELTRNLDIPKIPFYDAIKSLIDNGYIIEITNINQRNDDLQSWGITVSGAIIINNNKREFLRKLFRWGALVGFAALAIQCALLYEQNQLLIESNNTQVLHYKLDSLLRQEHLMELKVKK